MVIVFFATVDGSKIEINREKLSVIFYQENVIVNLKPVEVIQP